MYSIKPYFNLLLLALLASCSRENSNQQLSTSKPSLSVSQKSVQSGQSVNFTISNVIPNTISHWAVSSASGYTIDSIYSYANTRITFTQPGNYTVTAEMKYAPCSPDALAHPGIDSCFNSGTSKGVVSSTIEVK